MIDTAISVSLPSTDLVVKDELVLVFNHAYRNSELHRTASLALRHPAGVFLENRKHFLIVRDRLAFEKTPLDLVHLRRAWAIRDWTVMDCATPACSSSLQLSSLDRPSDSNVRDRLRLGPAGSSRVASSGPC